MNPHIDWTVPPDSQEIERLREAAQLSWPEKLQWLEDMHRLSEFISRQSNTLPSDLQTSNQST